MSGTVVMVGGVLVGCLEGVTLGVMAAGNMCLKGGLEAYKQLEIAKECSKRIKLLKEQQKHLLNTYNIETNKRCEIIRHNITEETIDVNRTPDEIYMSISTVCNELLSHLLTGSDEYKEIEDIEQSAYSIAMSKQIEMKNKIELLKYKESSFFSELEHWNELCNKHVSLRGKALGLTTTLEMLAKYCDEPIDIKPLDESILDIEMSKLESLIEKYEAKAKVAAESQTVNDNNKLLAEIVERSIKESGYNILDENQKEYGSECYYSFGTNSVLKSTTGKNGMIALNIQPKRGANTIEIKNDEEKFCTQAFDDIKANMENNGVAFKVLNQQKLNENNMTYYNNEESTSSSGSRKTSRRSNSKKNNMFNAAERKD